jgi:hypothetical protein
VSPGVSNAVPTTRPTAVVTGFVDGLGGEVAVLFRRAASQRPVASDSEGTDG